jgi:DNA-directed RNA polymerase, mitochondrial
MDWLRHVARLAANEGLPINWMTPAGFPVQQVYTAVKTRRIVTTLNGCLIKRMDLTIQEHTPNIDKSQQANGISPNFVHSMDAAALMLYIEQAQEKRGINSFACVHDSYGTHAADTEASVQCIRDVFVEMYKYNDVLENFKADILQMLSPKNVAKLKPIPEKGKLDIDDVRSSQFFFA